MTTEIHDPLNVSSNEDEIKRINSFINFLELKSDSSENEMEKYCYKEIKSYLEEHARCIAIDRWHAQTVRVKVDD